MPENCDNKNIVKMYFNIALKGIIFKIANLKIYCPYYKYNLGATGQTEWNGEYTEFGLFSRQ